MKFEEFLMQPASEDQRRRLALKDEVKGLQERLEWELRLNGVLRSTMMSGQSPGLDLSCGLPSPLLPFKVQVLLAELATVDEEILKLERKVRKLRMNLNRERKINTELELKLHKEHDPHQLSFAILHPKHQQHDGQANPPYSTNGGPQKRAAYQETMIRRDSFSSHASDVSRFNDGIGERSWRSTDTSHSITTSLDNGIINGTDQPNKLSEELLKALIGIFFKINDKSSTLESRHGRDQLNNTAKHHTISCISSGGFTPKSAFNCKARLDPFNDGTTHAVHPCVYDAAAAAGGGEGSSPSPHKGFIQINRRSLRKGYLQDRFPSTRKLRVLLQKLSCVDLTFLTYKQKLAFWINIYNACIMNAYLQHGLPSNQARMLSLMNKDQTDEKEMLLRHTYGLKYPEPNVTFALCRGNSSSPALRVYTPDEVVNQLESAKVEYLEAAIGVTSKRKILIPKLLQWHMQDFADDMDSLIEWIYSQLPQNGSLKRRIMESLGGEMKTPQRNKVEVVPYEYEFRYFVNYQEEKEHEKDTTHLVSNCNHTVPTPTS